MAPPVFLLATAGTNGYFIWRTFPPFRIPVFVMGCCNAFILILDAKSKISRPAEVELLLGDSTPIRSELGWKPKTSFDSLVKKMVEFDLNERKG